MKSVSENQIPQLNKKRFHPISLIISLVLICLMPFTNENLVYVAFAINVYRLIRYDEHSFLVDVVSLLAVSNLYRIPGGNSLFLVLISIADIYLLITKKVKFNKLFVLFLAFAVYLFARSDMMIVEYLTIVGGVFLLYVLSTSATPDDALTMTHMMVLTIIGSSIVGLVFMEDPRLLAYTRDLGLLSFGSDIYRFKGLFSDSNYYSTCLIVALSLLVQMFLCKKINPILCAVEALMIAFFGYLTYSKSFFLMSIGILLLFIILLFARGRYVYGGLLTTGTAMVVAGVVTGEIEIFSDVLGRFGNLATSTGDLNTLTTGRANAWTAYWQNIFMDNSVFFFGHGLDEPLLNRIGTHNLYLEILYYIGVIAFVLLLVFLAIVFVTIHKGHWKKLGLSQKLTSLLNVGVLMITYFALQGMFSSSLYVQILAVYVGSLIPAHENWDIKNLFVKPADRLRKGGEPDV